MPNYDFNPVSQLRAKKRPVLSRVFTDDTQEEEAKFELFFRRMSPPEEAVYLSEAQDLVNRFVIDDPVTGKTASGQVALDFPLLPVAEGEKQPEINALFIIQMMKYVHMQPPEKRVYDLIAFAAYSVGLDPDVWQEVCAFADEVNKTGAKKKQVTPTPATTNTSSEPVSDTPEDTRNPLSMSQSA